MKHHDFFSYSSLLSTVSIAVGLWVVWKISQAAFENTLDDDDDDHVEKHLQLPPHLERELMKDERRKRLMHMFTMKKPMYDNIYMKDPDGNILSTVSKKKANWYIKKQLAKWTDNNHKSIQLLFQPNMPAKGEKDPRQEAYNKTTKANICVVCGQGKDYMRHYVIPFRYRIQFPSAYKTHLPHDIVLLCANCHLEAERKAHKRMRRMEDELRSDSDSAASFLLDRQLYKISTSAQALLKWREKLPPSRIEEYTVLLEEWVKKTSTDSRQDGNNGDVGKQHLTSQILEELSQLDYKKPNPKFVSGPDLIRATLQTDQDIRNFIMAWRSHFLETSQPRYLPSGWSVDSLVRCDRREST